MKSVRLGRKTVKIIIIAALLIIAAIPAIAATSSQNTSNILYWTLNHNTSTISNPNTQTSYKGTSYIYAGNEYYVPYTCNVAQGGDWGSSLYIYSPVNTTVRIDSNNDGSFETVLNITANNLTLYLSPITGSHIVSNDSVFISYRYHSNDYGIYDDGDFAYTLYPVSVLGTDYYLPSSPTLISMVATQSNTNIQVDTNNDGTPEATYSNLSPGTVVNYTSPPAGTHVTSNNPIFVVAVNYNWANHDSTYAYSLLPTDRLGTDYWFNIDYKYSLFNTVTDYTGLHIVATQNNTQIQVNSTNYALNAGQSVTYYFNKGSAHITSDKPVGVAYIFDDYATDPWAGINRHYMYACTLMPTSQLGTEYPLAYYVVATHDNTQVDIDSNYDNIFENTVYLNAGQAINTFYIGSAEGGALLTNATGHIRSNYPVLSYYTFVRLWNSIGDYEFMYEMLPFQAAPFVTIIFPPSGGIVGSSVVWVNGTFDGLGNQITNITINDSRFTLVEPAGAGPYGVYGNYSFMAQGIGTSEFSVNVTVQDETGKNGSAIRHVIVDLDNPTVGITIPSSDTTVNTGTIWINGTYDGTWSTIQSVVINDSRFVLVAGSPFGVTGSYSFCNNTAIPTEEFGVRVTVTDGASLTGYAERHVIVDQSLPLVFIAVPASDITVNTGIIWINGTYDGRERDVVQISCNDSRFIPQISPPFGVVGNFSFSNSTPISTGSFYVQVSVRNNASLVNSVVRLVVVDQIPPFVTVIAPFSDTTINVGTIIILGYYSDTGSGVQQITCNDSRFTLQTGAQFGVSGAYMFVNNTPIWTSSFGVKVTVSDGAGLQSFVERSVIVNQDGVTGSGYWDVSSGLNQYVDASAVAGVELYLNTTAPVRVYITSTTANLGGSVPAGFGFLGGSLSILVNDTSAVQDVTIIIHYSHGSIINAGLEESSLRIRYWNETSGEWIETQSIVDTNNNIVTAYTNHLTHFAILGYPVLYSYIPLLLFFLLTPSGLNPLIYLALGLVAVALVTVAALGLLGRREEQVPKVEAPTPTKYARTQTPPRSREEAPKQKIVPKVRRITPQGETRLVTVPKRVKPFKTRLPVEELEAKREALKNLMGEINARFGAEKLTPEEYMEIYSKYSAKLASVEKKMGQFDSSIPVLRKRGCLFCGSEILGDTMFCPRCGGARLKCSVCQKNIVSGDRLFKCPHCGTLSHKDHLLEWIKVKGCCPNCNKKLRESDII